MEFQVGSIRFRDEYEFRKGVMRYIEFLEASRRRANERFSVAIPVLDDESDLPPHMRPIIHNGKECWC